MRTNFSLQQHLVLMLAVATFPIAGIALYAGFSEMGAELQRAQSNLQLSASLAASSQERFLESTKQLLIAFAIPSNKATRNPEQCREYFKALQQRLPQYNNFGIIDKNEYSQCHGGTAVGPVYLGDRSYFRDAIEKRDIAVGEYIHGRLTGKDTIALGLPLFDGQELTGVAFAEVNLEMVDKTLIEIMHAASARLSIVDRSATVLSSTEPSYAMGSQIGSTTLISQLKLDTQLSGEGQMGRLYAIHPVLGAGRGHLFAIVGVNKAEIVGNIRTRLMWESLALFISFLLVVGIAWRLGEKLVVRPVKKMLVAIEDLEAGDLESRLSTDAGQYPKEFATIARGFNLMAEALKKWRQDLLMELGNSRKALLTQEMILNSMHEGLLAVDSDGKILLRNATANRLLGLLELDSSIQQSPRSYGLFTPDSGTLYRLRDLPPYRALQGESGDGLLVLIRNKNFPDGRLVSCSYTPMLGEFGVSGALMVLSDITEKQKLEIQRDRDHALLHETQRTLLDAQRVGRIGNWEHDLITNKHWWSQQVYDLFGATKNDFNGTYDDFLKFILTEDQPHFCMQRDAALSTGTILDVEYRILRPDGEVFWLHEVGEVHKDADGKPVKFLGVVQDITERAKAEKDLRCYLATLERAAVAALAISRQLSILDILQETADQAIVTLDAQNAAIKLTFDDFPVVQAEASTSDEDVHFSGLNKASDDKTIDALIGEKTLPLRLTQAEMNRDPSWAGVGGRTQRGTSMGGLLVVPMMSTSSKQVGLLYLRGKTGIDFTQHQEYVAVELAQLASVALENAQRFEEVEAFNTELERKVTERTAELMQQQALFRTVADQAPQVMWIADPEMQVTYLNRYWYDLVGGAEPMWFGDTWTSVVDPSDAAVMRRKWEAVLQSGAAFGGERRIRALDGVACVFSYRVAPVRNAAGDIFCWVGIDADVTELKTAESALRLAVQELEAFSYSVSHDLRSPLSTLEGFSSLLAKQLEGIANEKARHYISRIQAGAMQMGQLIEGLLSLAQVSRTKLRFEATNLSTLAIEILDRHISNESTRSVSTHVETELQTYGDSRLLRAVMENLLGNAWKFTSRQVHTEITVGRKNSPEGEVIFFVKDNGAGFDMAYADKLFGTFQRLHSDTEFSGTGIGLATVRRVIDSHGGRIWAESRPGQGATFFFTLSGVRVTS